MNGHMENLTILPKNIYCKNTHQEVVLRLECLFKIIILVYFTLKQIYIVVIL